LECIAVHCFNKRDELVLLKGKRQRTLGMNACERLGRVLLDVALIKEPMKEATDRGDVTLKGRRREGGDMEAVKIGDEMSAGDVFPRMELLLLEGFKEVNEVIGIGLSRGRRNASSILKVVEIVVEKRSHRCLYVERLICLI
jgi:hypothetical protein